MSFPNDPELLEKYLSGLNLHSDDDDDDDHDYNDDYYSDSDGSCDKYELPPRVRSALDARRHLLSKLKDGNGTPPPIDEEAIRLFQQHVKNGLFKPEYQGGYMEIMGLLGAVPKSTDPYAKDIKYNRWLFMFQTDQESKMEERWAELMKRHSANLRYLRFQEYVDRYYPALESYGYYWGSENDNKSRGDYVGPRCTQKQTDDEVQLLEEKKQFVDEDDLDRTQFTVLMNDFTSSFFWYVNEKCRLAKAAGMNQNCQRMGSAPDAVQVMEFDMSMATILEQCEEVADMYREKQRPCGMYLEANSTTNTSKNLSKGKNNKKKKKKNAQQQQSFKPNYEKHRTRINEVVPELIYSLKHKILNSSLGSARVASSIAAMLWEGAQYDPAIACCILFHDSGKVLQTIMNLCQLASKYAKEAIHDTSRLTLAGHMWWNAYGELTDIIAFSLRGSVNEQHQHYSNDDTHSREEVLKKTIMPYFLELIDPRYFKKERDPASPAVWYCEESAVWNAISNILQTFSKPFGAKFIKTHWNAVESYCSRDIESEMNARTFDTDREKSYERFMAAQSLAEAVMFISNLCGYSFDVEEGFSRMIVPGPLALAILKKGAVPLLVKLSRSKYDLVSQLAVYGLSQMTRIKDCRDLLYQLPNNDGIKFVNDMMTSKDADCASNNMLVVLHLSWDEEWIPKLLSMRPKIEEICLKVAAFAMKSLLERIEEMKPHREKLEDRSDDLSSAEITAKTDKERERIEDEREDIDRRLKATDWELYESEVAKESDIFLLTISRALLVLSSGAFRTGSIHRLEATDFLHLLASSLDCPFPDTTTTALALFHNYLNLGAKADPTDFPDPDHVVESLFDNIIAKADAQDQTESMVVLISSSRALYRRRNWQRIFHDVAKKNESAQMFLDMLIVPGRNDPEPPRSSVATEERHGIHSSCTVNTGRLAKCNFCGRLEGKRGDWKKCARCQVVK